jgi:hypothetical protein
MTSGRRKRRSAESAMIPRAEKEAKSATKEVGRPLGRGTIPGLDCDGDDETASYEQRVEDADRWGRESPNRELDHVDGTCCSVHRNPVQVRLRFLR